MGGACSSRIMPRPTDNKIGRSKPLPYRSSLTQRRYVRLPKNLVWDGVLIAIRSRSRKNNTQLFFNTLTPLRYLDVPR